METIFLSMEFRVLVEFLLKSSLILGAALLASRVFRNRSASFRHSLLALSLLGIIILPVLMTFAPDWQTGLAPSFLAKPNRTAPVPGTGHARAALTSDVPGSGITINRTALGSSSHATADREAVQVPDRATAVTLSSPGVNDTTLYWLLGLWAIGVTFLLVKLVTGFYGTALLSCRSERVTGYPWIQLLQWFRNRAKLKPKVKLLKSSRVTVPVTWGMIKPVILLPDESGRWPLDQCSSVLFHELSHVKRRDFPIRFLARLTCSLYWFNPLCWMVFRRLKREQEKACDEMVLQSGVKASTYASHLLHMKKTAELGGWRHQPAAAIGMAGKSEFNERMQSILKKQIKPMEVKMKTKLSLLIITLLAVVLVGTAKPYDQEKKPVKPKKPDKVKVAAPKLPAAKEPTVVPAVRAIPEPKTLPLPRLAAKPEPVTAPVPATESNAKTVPAPAAEPALETTPEEPAPPLPEKKKKEKKRKEKTRVTIKTENSGKNGESNILYLKDTPDGRLVILKDCKILIDGKEISMAKGDIIKLETGYLVLENREGKIKKIKVSNKANGKKATIRISADKLAVGRNESELGGANVVALVKEGDKTGTYSIYLKDKKHKDGKDAVLVTGIGKGSWTVGSGMVGGGDADIYIDGSNDKKIGIYSKKKDGKITLRRRLGNRRLGNGNNTIDITFHRSLKGIGKLAEFKCTEKHELSPRQVEKFEKAFAGFKKKLPAGYVMENMKIKNTLQFFSIKTTRDGLNWPETKKVYNMLVKLNKTVAGILSELKEV